MAGIPKDINTTYDVVSAFRAIEDELTASMIRNLDHHRAEELEAGFNWSQWQVEQLAALDAYKKRNLKKYQGIFKNINLKIDTIISMQRAAGNADQEVSLLKAIKEGAKLYKAKKQVSADGRFFKENDKKINALIKATKSDFKKAEIAILRRANDQYRQVIFNAQMYAATGASYEKAVDMATKDFLRAGINCIEYKNGARHTMSEYADMALRTAQKRAYLTGEGEKRQEWGVTTVIMNKRGNPCPKCLPFVGKVLIDDVWSGGKPEDGPYPLMSTAISKVSTIHDVRTVTRRISKESALQMTPGQRKSCRQSIREINRKRKNSMPGCRQRSMEGWQNTLWMGRIRENMQPERKSGKKYQIKILKKKMKLI